MNQGKPTVALLNDSSLYNSHFGCQLVCQTFREQFSRVGLELKVSLPGNIDMEHVDRLLADVDLVVVNGEGTIHHGKAPHLIQVAGRYPAVLVNCVYQKNDPLPELREFRFVTARESLSAQALGDHGVDPIVVPDVIFASSFLNSFVPAVQSLDDLGKTDNVTSPKAGFGPHVSLVSEYLNKLCSYQKLCIGRYHAAIAAICLGIPFSTWDSNTWKTKGMMQDMGLLHLHAESQKQALRCVPETLDPVAQEYASLARIKVRKMFDNISEIAHNQVCK